MSLPTKMKRYVPLRNYRNRAGPTPPFLFRHGEEWGPPIYFLLMQDEEVGTFKSGVGPAAPLFSGMVRSGGHKLIFSKSNVFKTTNNKPVCTANLSLVPLAPEGLHSKGSME